LLPAELPWLIRLRWLAGLAIIAGAIDSRRVGRLGMRTRSQARRSVLFVLLYNTVFWHLVGRLRYASTVRACSPLPARACCSIWSC
jgi:hypothetical protein